MEGLNSKDYRDNLAKDLKEIRKTDTEKAQSVLTKEKNTEEYQKAFVSYLEEKEINKVNLNDFFEELSITTNKKEIPADAISIDTLKKSFNFSMSYTLNGYPEVIDFITKKLKASNHELFYETDTGDQKIDASLIPVIKEKFQEAEKQATIDWTTLGEWVMTHYHPGYARQGKFTYSVRDRKIPQYLEPVIMRLAEQKPDEVEIFSVTERVLDNEERKKPYIYYSKTLIETAREIIESQKVIKNPENWYTPYQAAKELKISRENLDLFLLEYKEKEPEYLIEKDLENKGSISPTIVYIYKELFNEIKRRVEGGEKKIIPEGWKTIQQIAKSAEWGEFENLEFILGYITKVDKDIAKIVEYEKFQARLRKRSELVIKNKKDFYFSPDFQEILKKKVIEFQNNYVPEGYKTIREGISLPTIHKDDKADFIKVMEKLHEVTKKYEDLSIYKIVDFKLQVFYPSEFFVELEKRISDSR